MTTQPKSFAERAALTVQYGVPVIPLPPRSKDACLPAWHKAATTDDAQIAKWDKQNRLQNCAAVALPGGFWMLDLDDSNVPEQIKNDTGHSLAEIDTLVVKSSGEKRHYYFRHDVGSEAMGNRKHVIHGKEIFSVRAHNAYVVAAGSIHPDTGGEYEIGHEPTFGEIPVAPPWLTDWIMNVTSHSQTSAPPETSVELETVPEGGRDNWLFDQACKLRDLRYAKATVLTLVQQLNQNYCTPPMPDSVIVRKVNSAFTREPRVKNPPPNDSANTETDHKLDLIPLSDIEAEIQEWLWLHRIPKGALTNLSGDADNGKSMVLYDILARISSGADFPDGAANPYGGKPQKVILLFSEGSLKTTVKPRMAVMGANMSNVLTLKSVSIKGEKDETKRQFYLKTDLDLLRKQLQQDPSIAVIGFDPLTNYLGDDCNMNKSQDVRRVLTPLCEVAEEFGVTIIAIIHFSKNTAMNAIHRTGGAAALVEVPRAAWCCIKDDDPENADSFIFARIKNNLGKRTGGLSYRIKETFITIKGQQVSQPKLIWGERNDKSADDLLTMQNVPEIKGVAKAKAWLEELFKDGKGRKSTWVYATALAQGLTEDCIKNANRVLRSETKRYAERWYMRRRQGESVPWDYANDLDDHRNEPIPTADEGEPL